MSRSLKAKLFLAACTVIVAAGSIWSADVILDRTQKFQTIDGFGFFGGKDVWWSSNNASDFYSSAWCDRVIDDLGITIWRNEYYSEVGTDASKQDATWTKQKPTVQALNAKAIASGVPLKFFWTVWSPPSSFKCEGDGGGGGWGFPTTTPRADLRWGGTLCEGSQNAFADWLIAGIKLYKDAGVNVYTISFQNEPMFMEPYNSCFYDKMFYSQTLKVIQPKIKAAYPNVKLLGGEDMLAALMDGTKLLFDYTFEGSMINYKTDQYMDIWAYHGYSDGVNPTPASVTSKLWAYAYSSLKATNKPIWQTETSGYNDTWGSSTERGAMELWSAIHQGLYYGNMAAWVHWYGSDFIDASTSTPKGKRFYALKHFFRFVRPGAVRVAATVNGSSNIFLTAYEHSAMNSFVVAGMNNSDASVTLNLSGANVPSEFTLFQTTATENCANKGTVNSTSITIPAQSVFTLVNGNVYDKPVATIPGLIGKKSGFTQGHTPVNMVYRIDGKALNGVRKGNGVNVILTKYNNGTKATPRIEVRQ